MRASAPGTAPTAGNYQFSGLFERLDGDANGGNGVIVNIFKNTALNGIEKLFAEGIAPSTQFTAKTFNSSTTLGLGDTLSFVVRNNGEYSYDSTGLNGRITQLAAVPEASSWAMMVIGFGAVGGAMRRRQRAAARFA